MDINEFRECGHSALEFLIDYFKNIRDRDVLPLVEPGYLHKLLPCTMPLESEKWQDVMKDFNNFIMPGMTHWQSPNFHAFYPSQTSFPAIIGDMLTSALATQGFNWICSPACTELEVIVMNWLGKFLNLPSQFLSSENENSHGGGIIQGSASEAILITVLAAREEKVREIKLTRPDMSEGKIRAKLIGYASVHANSAIEKAGILAATKVRLIESNESSQMCGEALEKAIMEDLRSDLIPFICIATLGTTATCAFDKLDELGPICSKFNVWCHVDAAYAGAVFCLPEYQFIMNGIEHVDSINFNLHKWMLVNFECCAMWINDSRKLTNTFNVERIYLNHENRTDAHSPDYRNWQLALGRRFRSLRVWFTLRIYGQDYIRRFLRKQISLTNLLAEKMKIDDRFVVVGSSLALMFFQLRQGDEMTGKLIKKINDKKKIYLTPATLQNKIIIRFVICGHEPDERDIEFAWHEIRKSVDEIFDAASYDSYKNHRV